jgi:hypothetical protein
MSEHGGDAPRPRDFALLRLAALGGPPRDRARDQQADLAGIAIERAILDALVTLDPGPDTLEAALAGIVATGPGPDGPRRAVAALLMREWREIAAAPGYWAWLAAEGVHEASREARRRGGRSDVEAPGKTRPAP